MSTQQSIPLALAHAILLLLVLGEHRCSFGACDPSVAGIGRTQGQREMLCHREVLRL